MKTCYIAGMITGDDNYKQKFATAERHLTERGYAVVNPAWLPSTGFTYQQYMEIALRIYNFKHIKSRYPEIKFFGDTDFVLQELLSNRIILREDYFCPRAQLERNKGGMNITRNKKLQDELAEMMKQKWGKYFSFKNSGFLDNVTRIMVPR